MFSKFLEKCVFIKAAFFVGKEKSKSQKPDLALLQKSAEARFNITVGSCTNFPNCPLVFLKNPILSIYL